MDLLLLCTKILDIQPVCQSTTYVIVSTGDPDGSGPRNAYLWELTGNQPGRAVLVGAPTIAHMGCHHQPASIANGSRGTCHTRTSQHPSLIRSTNKGPFATNTLTSGHAWYSIVHLRGRREFVAAVLALTWGYRIGRTLEAMDPLEWKVIGSPEPTPACPLRTPDAPSSSELASGSCVSSRNTQAHHSPFASLPSRLV